ncbi:ABC transporter permease [Muricoccus radiodurans]|uniref:ABC transporter permease n=1 Tax=Muricoccus radiodurans TaxID=2231721 RepID=UPI003CF6E663
MALYRLLLLVVLLLAWQFASGPLVPEFFISKPSAILAALRGLVTTGNLFFHVGITATEAFVGFILGAAAGVAAGVLLGRIQFLADLLQPFILAFYSLPKIALAPLFILWIGIGMEMKIVLTGTVVFFLVFLNTFTGVRNVSRELVAILRLMGAEERHVLGKVVLPSAITWVFAGLRISVPYALIGAIVGELIAANRGLGFVLANASSQFDTAGVFAALIVIMLLAFLLNALVRLAEKWLMPWKAREAEREVAI